MKVFGEKVTLVFVVYPLDRATWKTLECLALQKYSIWGNWFIQLVCKNVKSNRGPTCGPLCGSYRLLLQWHGVKLTYWSLDLGWLSWQSWWPRRPNWSWHSPWPLFPSWSHWASETCWPLCPLKTRLSISTRQTSSAWLSSSTRRSCPASWTSGALGSRAARYAR